MYVFGTPKWTKPNAPDRLPEGTSKTIKYVQVPVLILSLPQLLLYRKAALRPKCRRWVWNAS